MPLLPGEYIEGMHNLYKVYRRQLLQQLRGYELTPAEIEVLLFLYNNTPTLDTATDIARCKKLSKALVARAVESLYRRGYITFERDPHDRRVVHLSLSEKSLPITQELGRRQRLLWQQLGEGIPPEELAAALKTLSRFIHNAQKNLTGEESNAKE